MKKETTSVADSTILKPNHGEHEAVTEFRGVSPQPLSGLELYLDVTEDENNLGSVITQFGDLVLEEIPFVNCISDIADVLVKFKKPVKPEDTLTIHRKLVLFINAMTSSVEISDTEAAYIINALEKSSYLVEIIVANNLYMDKIMHIFLNEQQTNPVAVKNNFSLLSKIQQIVLEKLDKCNSTSDTEWGESDSAVNFLLAFTRSSSCMNWFLNHLEYIQVSDFLLQLVVKFYCKPEFSIIVAEWLKSTNLIEELVTLFQHISSPHDNIALLLEGLLDFCWIHRRARGTNLASQLFSLNLISIMVSSLLMLLKAPTCNSRDDGVIQGFRILSSLLRLDYQKPSAHKIEYLRHAIVIVIDNKELMEAIYKVLRLGGPKIYFKLTSKGTSPLGRVRRTVLGFVHNIVAHADRKALKTILELPTIEYLIKYLFWLHPFNSFVHIKVRLIITVLLRSNIRKAAEMLILRTNFLEGAFEFLKKPSPPGQQRAHIMRIISVWVNYRHASAVKDVMDKWMEMNPSLQPEWELLVLKDLPVYLRKQGTLLGGVPKPARKSPERA
ncbi:unnamed protein product [Allacma fusca]|uniref:Uncharacterized protein n=1 Tax=Allacma fusca TaxID=39272 RepID=A0A8J2NYS7_9HEXA|nr:unnamed protein product [Allacma fusca]